MTDPAPSRSSLVERLREYRTPRAAVNSTLLEAADEIEHLSRALEAIGTGHGWCRCHDALLPTLAERDSLRSALATAQEQLAEEKARLDWLEQWNQEQHRPLRAAIDAARRKP